MSIKTGAFVPEVKISTVDRDQLVARLGEALVAQCELHATFARSINEAQQEKDNLPPPRKLHARLKKLAEALEGADELGFPHLVQEADAVRRAMEALLTRGRSGGRPRFDAPIYLARAIRDKLQAADKKPTTYLDGHYMRLCDALFTASKLGNFEHTARRALEDSGEN